MTDVREPLDELYFKWLMSLTIHDGAPTLNDHVYRVLYKTPFEYIVANDYNRAWEGVSLRYEFLETSPLADTSNLDDWLELESSVLEMLIALAYRAAYQTEDDPAWWFSIFTTNLGLSSSPSKADKIVRVLNKRHYDPDGYGGLFPLNNPEADQREVEIWYQLAAYILENEMY